ncbi:hypothetical protein QWY75_08600 [Pontixanthobacter aestiaquae]|uniref:Uncharacterized protein n=1 Tax=Pontixanthobacter aestiaquae TaxID=1509367 RepID=A0A844Z7H4_9SPHN|nr:hypothetical protein [Pontixanthobacter aestiaquae]MDN3646258.1 hypothetical protein [Pontixanthobacter aestiaquae]MXO82750.1 hypothetical protein [Pontixanthobacter aestiaquae]
MSDEAHGPKGPNTSGMLGKFGTIVLGLVLLLVGIAMLDPDEFAQSKMSLGLAAAIAALGMAIIATVFLPHAINVNGGQFKPFGVDVKASGGGAVFFLVLIFLYLANDGKVENAETTKPGAEETGQVEPAKTPDPAPTPLATAQPTTAPDSLPEPALDPMEEPATASAIAVPGPGYLNWPYNQPFQFAEGLARYRTFSDFACPDGPSGCPAAGGAAHFNDQIARESAFAMCVNNGGAPFECQNNLEAF